MKGQARNRVVPFGRGTLLAILDEGARKVTLRAACASWCSQDWEDAIEQESAADAKAACGLRPRGGSERRNGRLLGIWPESHLCLLKKTRGGLDVSQRGEERGRKLRETTDRRRQMSPGQAGRASAGGSVKGCRSVLVRFRGEDGMGDLQARWILRFLAGPAPSSLPDGLEDDAAGESPVSKSSP